MSQARRQRRHHAKRSLRSIQNLDELTASWGRDGQARRGDRYGKKWLLFVSEAHRLISARGALYSLAQALSGPRRADLCNVDHQGTPIELL